MSSLFGRVIMKSEKKKYIILNRNQLNIFDSLLYDGSIKKYIDKKKNLRYSEHSGYLDFTVTNLFDRIIVSAITNREDYDDKDILLPYDLYDSYKYKYLFHTHPPTLGRLANNIIYEFPSVDDIFHFIDHYNMGNTIGSIIIAPEGIYILYPNDFSIKKIKYDIELENEIISELNEGLFNIQDIAIQKYGKQFTKETFYNTIALDNTYIKLYNKLVNKFFDNQLKIVIEHRSLDKIANKWIIKKLYLPI